MNNNIEFTVYWDGPEHPYTNEQAKKDKVILYGHVSNTADDLLNGYTINWDLVRDLLNLSIEYKNWVASLANGVSTEAVLVDEIIDFITNSVRIWSDRPLSNSDILKLYTIISPNAWDWDADAAYWNEPLCKMLNIIYGEKFVSTPLWYDGEALPDNVDDALSAICPECFVQSGKLATVIKAITYTGYIQVTSKNSQSIQTIELGPFGVPYDPAESGSAEEKIRIYAVQALQDRGFGRAGVLYDALKDRIFRQ